MGMVRWKLRWQTTLAHRDGIECVIDKTGILSNQLEIKIKHLKDGNTVE